MKITVLCGGITPERDVSLRSGAMIANALISRGHSAALVDSFVGVSAFVGAGASGMAGLFRSEPYPVPKISGRDPDLAPLWERYRAPGDPAQLGPGVLEACRAADVTYIALHGGGGEGGLIQAALECFGIRYTGSGSVASGIAMDKDLTKRLIRAAGIDTADWKRYENISSPSECAEDIASVIGVPCVIKPLGCGSTCGITVVRSRDKLDGAVELAVKYQPALLAEKCISGREFTVAVLEDGNGGAVALPAVEIQPKEGGYDYANKYQAGRTTETCPARIPEETAKRAADVAVAVHRTVGLRGISRTDMIWDTEADRLVVLEVNTAPGMTDTSLVPQEAAAAGISYAELCERIAVLGMRREIPR